MTNEEFIKAIKEHYIEILKDIINDNKRLIKRQQITIAILILFLFLLMLLGLLFPYLR